LFAFTNRNVIEYEYNNILFQFKRTSLKHEKIDSYPCSPKIIPFSIHFQQKTAAVHEISAIYVGHRPF